MDSNPADTILHFIAKITDVIEFPVGDAEFDADLSRELEAELGRALSADEQRVFLEAVEG